MASGDLISAGAATGCTVGPAGAGRVLRIDGKSFPAPVLCAPLSGITDVPFRRLVLSLGAELVFSEMVASGELVRNTLESQRRAMGDGAGLRAVQLAGREPAFMRAAAERLAGEGVQLIDINFGCPAKKVVGGLSGSALMREPDLAARLVDATLAGAGATPVSVKMRLGWDRQSLNAAHIAGRAADAGVVMVTVHGRTRDQFYDGQADWAAIAEVRQAIDLPLIVNGDIATQADIDQARRLSGADGAMIGRALCGRPWLIGMITGALDAARLGAIDFGELVRSHYEAMLAHYGREPGLRHARKHVGWYLDRFAASAGHDLAADRAALMRCGDAYLVSRTLGSLFEGASLADIEAAAQSTSQRKAA